MVLSINMLTPLKADDETHQQLSQTHRALVFQGGGALGAYEAGMYKALYDKLNHIALKEKRLLFDIVSGTSAGAINASIIVSHFLQNKDKSNPWEGSAEKLEEFWNDVSTDTSLYENPFLYGFIDTSSFLRDRFNDFWVNALESFDEYSHNFRNNPYFQSFHYLWPDRLGKLASKESFRRYFSWLQFSYLPMGIHNVLSPPIYQPDFHFMNPFNHMLKYDNDALTKTIKKYWDYEELPIKSAEGQPRLLLIAVDVQDATTITFDSYPKKGGQMLSIYGNEDIKQKHQVRYDKGIGIEHLLTTMSSHVRLDFPTLNAITGEVENDQIIEGTMSPRPFMDGFYLSNTPLREVLQSHRDYWYKVKGIEDRVPSLDIYIGDLYPQIEEGTPRDPDAINNRVQNILFHDKTKYDEKVTTMISDYVNIINELIDMVRTKDKNITKDSIYGQLEQQLRDSLVSNKRNGEPRDIKNLLKGRFTINQVLRVVYGDGQKIDDSDDIFGKAFDFSTKTINYLIAQGINDTIAKFDLK